MLVGETWVSITLGEKPEGRQKRTELFFKQMVCYLWLLSPRAAVMC